MHETTLWHFQKNNHQIIFWGLCYAVLHQLFNKRFLLEMAVNLTKSRLPFSHINRAAQRQSVRSSRSETTDFTFDETDVIADGDQRSTHIRRDVTFSEWNLNLGHWFCLFINRKFMPFYSLKYDHILHTHKEKTKEKYLLY